MSKEIEIVQSNYLVRSKSDIENNDFSLTAIQKRCLLYIIHQIREQEHIPHKLGENWVKIKPYEMTKNIMPNKHLNMSHGWDELREFRDSKYKILIKYFDEEGNLRERDTSWILEIDRPVTGASELDIHVPNLIHKHVKQLDGNFTKMSLDYCTKLKSANQIRMYEILLSYAYMGEWSVSTKQFRHMLDIRDDKYPKFTMFKIHVLDKCIQAINDKTNLNVSFEVIRTGNKPLDLCFSISYKNKQLSDKEKRDLSKKELKKHAELEKPLSDLEKALMKRDVVLHSKYKDEGITEDHWKEALKNNELVGPKLVTEARAIKDKEVLLNLENVENDKKQNLVDSNKDWYEDNKEDFDLLESTAYLQDKKGEVIPWNDVDFKEKLNDRRKGDRRTSALVIQGTSNHRKGDRRK